MRLLLLRANSLFFVPGKIRYRCSISWESFSSFSFFLFFLAASFPCVSPVPKMQGAEADRPQTTLPNIGGFYTSLQKRKTAWNSLQERKRINLKYGGNEQVFLINIMIMKFFCRSVSLKNFHLWTSHIQSSALDIIHQYVQLPWLLKGFSSPPCPIYNPTQLVSLVLLSKQSQHRRKKTSPKKRKSASTINQLDKTKPHLVQIRVR